MSRHTKIVVTIGPASQDEAMLRNLVRGGMDAARLNFSHGTYEEHARRIQRLRQICADQNRPVTVIQDLQGPKIRTGNLRKGEVELAPGQALTLTTEDVLGDENIVSVDFPDLPRSVQPGGRILLADGQMELVVTGVEGDRVETQVILGGTLGAHQGVNLPGIKLEIPSFTEKDEADLAFGLEHEVDAVAMSFVRTADDVARVRKAIRSLSPGQAHTPVIAKLERPEALANLDDILQAADGVMVARGDLGVEMSPEEVPIAQKRIIESANRQARLVITATQMLESMIHNPRPTRAEASDVANAIFDGSDAVMLSGETAIGDFPAKVVQMMDAIIRQAEANLEKWGHWRRPQLDHPDDETRFVARAACELGVDRDVAAIAVFTRSGRTALLMSKTRPIAPILAFTPEESTYRRLSLYWGVVPHLVPHADTVEDMLNTVEATILAETPIRAGQQVVVVCGFPVGAMRPPNLVLLHTIGED